ncbi:MAG: PAS domain-containing protein, partial [SAR324 cluster bacterium]|nr:PAS domain-containing protein [SAR324 cluster bacterium]
MTGKVLRLLQSLIGEQKSSPSSDDSSEIIERYHLLTENLAAAVLLRDGSGKILYCSPYTEVLTGYPIAAIL